MKKYRVIKTLTLHEGPLGLSKEQVATRRLRLREEKGKFYPTSPVSFKAGEIIGLEGVAKINSSLVEEIAGKPVGGKGD